MYALSEAYLLITPSVGRSECVDLMRLNEWVGLLTNRKSLCYISKTALL